MPMMAATAAIAAGTSVIHVVVALATSKFMAGLCVTHGGHMSIDLDVWVESLCCTRQLSVRHV